MNSPASSNPVAPTSLSTSGSSTYARCESFFLGPQPKDRQIRGQLNVDTVGEDVAAAGLKLVDLRHEEIKEEFFDIGAIVYFLRKLSWVVPDFSVAKYRDKLRDLHDQIQSDGSFITHSSRLLIEAHKAQ